MRPALKCSQTVHPESQPRKHTIHESVIDRSFVVAVSLLWTAMFYFLGSGWRNMFAVFRYKQLIFVLLLRSGKNNYLFDKPCTQSPRPGKRTIHQSVIGSCFCWVLVWTFVLFAVLWLNNVASRNNQLVFIAGSCAPIKKTARFCCHTVHPESHMGTHAFLLQSIGCRKNTCWEHQTLKSYSPNKSIVVQ